MVDGVVEQVAVVRHRDHAAREGGDQLLELAATIGVQVGLGLVQQQEVRLRDQARRQRDELALAAGELARRQRQVLLGDVEREELAAHLPGQAGSADLDPPIQQSLLPLEDARHARKVGDHVGAGELLLHRAELAVQLGHVGARGHDRRLRGALVAVGVLVQVRSHQSAAANDLSGGGLFEVGEEP